MRIATYTHRGVRHTIDMTKTADGRRVTDQAEGEPTRLIADLGPDENVEHALAILNGGGRYLERAAAGEAHLCRELDPRASGVADDAATAA